MRPSNTVVMIGRLVRDVDIRFSQGENSTAIARFAIAVDRGRKNAEGKYESDFPTCVAFGSTAEFIQKYFHQGNKIAVCGELRTGSYTNKEGQKVYTTEINVDKVDFVERASEANGDGSAPQANKYKPTYINPNQSGSGAFKREPVGDGFMQIPTDVESEALPWN